mgnify:FL=1
MQTRKRAKPVKFGVTKKEEKPVIQKEAEVVITKPEEKETKVISQQKVVRIT